MAEPFLSEIRILAFDFAPRGWARCDGQLLSINQNQALYSLLGTTYGGDGRTTFALPDLRGRVSMHVGSGFTQGQVGGEENHTLTAAEMPQHSHFLQGRAERATLAQGAIPAATKAIAQGVSATTPVQDVNMYSTGAPNVAMSPASVTNAGGSQPHVNMQPYNTLNFCIALQGLFPSRN